MGAHEDVARVNRLIWSRFLFFGVFTWLYGGMTSLVDFAQAVAWLLLAGIAFMVAYVVKP